MEKLVLDYIKENNLIETNDKVLVAVSGGPDSICLLNILYNLQETLGIELFVAHMNHLIREDANEDAEYVRNFCKEKNIQFFMKECNVVNKSAQEKIGLEEAGRNARYDFFKEVAENNNITKIAIAHNRNDLVETLIMNVFRGSGTKGLKSIQNRNGMYIRPLLNTDRKDIEQYCSDKNLNPRIDKTNFENIYTRNKVRNIVIPYIKNEFNPNIVETLVRLSQIACEEQEFIEKETEKYFKKLLIAENDVKISINGKDFVNLNNAIKKRMILHIVNKLFNTTQGIEKKHIEDVVKLIDNNIGNKYLTPNKNLKISIKKGIVDFVRI